MLLKWDIEAQSYGRLNVSKLRISKLDCCDASISPQLTITASVNKKCPNWGSILNCNYQIQIVLKVEILGQLVKTWKNTLSKVAYFGFKKLFWYTACRSAQKAHSRPKMITWLIFKTKVCYFWRCFFFMFSWIKKI